MVKALPISRIRCDGDTQPRARLNPVVVDQYAQSLAAGAKFPPVLVFDDGENMWLVEGFHRKAAHEQVGKKQIECEIRKGTLREAILYAISTNAEHGLQRTHDDRRHCVLKMLFDAEWGKWSDREIARHAKVSHVFVGRMRLANKSGDDKRLYLANGKAFIMDVSARRGVRRLAESARELIRDTYLTDDHRKIVELARVPDSDQAAVVCKLLKQPKLTVKQVLASIHRQRKVKEMQRIARSVELSPDDCRVICGDSLKVLPTLADESIDLIFCDPQYNISWRYRSGKSDARADDEYLDECRQWIAQCARLLKPGGSIFIMCASRYSDCIGMILRETAGLRRQDTIILDEPGGRYVRTKLSDCYRPLHWYSKAGGDGAFHSDAAMFNGDMILEPSRRQTKYNDGRKIPDGRVPSNVWPFLRVNGNDGEKITDKEAPPQLPVELVERVVLMASNPGDTVLDPFCGTGATARACIPHGRKFIGIEIDPVIQRKSMTWIKQALAARQEAA